MCPFRISRPKLSGKSFTDQEFLRHHGFFEWLESKTYKMHVRVYLPAIVPMSLQRLPGQPLSARDAFLPAPRRDHRRLILVGRKCLEFFSEPWPDWKRTGGSPAGDEIKNRLQF